MWEEHACPSAPLGCSVLGACTPQTALRDQTSAEVTSDPLNTLGPVESDTSWLGVQARGTRGRPRRDSISQSNEPASHRPAEFCRLPSGSVAPLWCPNDPTSAGARPRPSRASRSLTKLGAAVQRANRISPRGELGEHVVWGKIPVPVGSATRLGFDVALPPRIRIEIEDPTEAVVVSQPILRWTVLPAMGPL